MENSNEYLKEFAELLVESTPRLLSKFIKELEQDKGHNFTKIILMTKRVAFCRMLEKLNASQGFLTKKRYKTELYIDPDTKSVALFISKKDSQDMGAMRIRLYDQHKDEMLELIDRLGVGEHEAQSHAFR